jgi:hypothetical protein
MRILVPTCLNDRLAEGSVICGSASIRHDLIGNCNWRVTKLRSDRQLTARRRALPVDLVCKRRLDYNARAVTIFEKRPAFNCEKPL